MFGFGKGKIEVILEKYNFKPGETIKGKIKVKMKKPTKARQLKVVFAGTKTSSSSNTMGLGNSGARIGIGSRNRQQTKTTQEFIHKFEMPLDGEKEYTEQEYDLEILVPVDVLQRGSGPGGNVGAALQAVQFLSGSSTRIEWFVQATLDIDKGLDVNKKVQINVG